MPWTGDCHHWGLTGSIASGLGRVTAQWVGANSVVCDDPAVLGIIGAG